MRTTIDIPDIEYRLLKERAARGGVSVKSLVLAGVRTLLEDRSSSTKRRLREPILNGGRAGSLSLDNEKVYDLIDFP